MKLNCHAIAKNASGAAVPARAQPSLLIEREIGASDGIRTHDIQIHNQN
jgi:hypothetical protein